jgi:hypothetical protein
MCLFLITSKITCPADHHATCHHPNHTSSQPLTPPLFFFRYDQVSEALFNPDFGLFLYSGVDQMCMQINPASGMVESAHRRYFRFVGRLLGKALFDGQLVGSGSSAAAFSVGNQRRFGNHQW